MTIPGDTTIGLIGTGNMGMAIIKGLLEHITPQQIATYDIDQAKSDLLSAKYGLSPANSPEYLVNKANIIVLAVKPQQIAELLPGIKNHLTIDKVVVSIAAGVTLSALEEQTRKGMPVIRIMPNTPALVGEGMTVLSPNEFVQEKDLAVVEAIFTHIGKTLVLPEHHMDAVTGLSGSGPAYVFTFIQGLVDAGVKQGLPRDKALTLACQTIIGSAKLVVDTQEDPISLRGKVTSPGGTTIEAVHVLERSRFTGIVMDAVEAATIKSKKLGE